MAERTIYGEWEMLNSLGRGGQGEVFRARKAYKDPPNILEDIQQVIGRIAGVNTVSAKNGAAERLVSMIRFLSTEDHGPVCALKILHPIAIQPLWRKLRGE
jgi:hypothetical protein